MDGTKLTHASYVVHLYHSAKFSVEDTPLAHLHLCAANAHAQVDNRHRYAFARVTLDYEVEPFEWNDVNSWNPDEGLYALPAFSFWLFLGKVSIAYT